MGEHMSGFGGTAVMDREVFSQPAEPTEMFGASEPASVERNEPTEPETFEQTIEAVDRAFNGATLTFKAYSGTAAEMAVSCPMAKIVFMKGSQAAISFLAKYNGTPMDVVVETPLGEEAKPTDGEPDQPKQTDGATELRQDTANEKEAEDGELRTDAAITMTVMTQTAIATTMDVAPVKRKSIEVIEIIRSDSGGASERPAKIENTAVPVKADIRGTDSIATPLPFLKREKEQQSKVNEPVRQKTVVEPIESKTEQEPKPAAIEIIEIIPADLPDIEPVEIRQVVQAVDVEPGSETMTAIIDEPEILADTVDDENSIASFESSDTAQDESELVPDPTDLFDAATEETTPEITVDPENLFESEQDSQEDRSLVDHVDALIAEAEKEKVLTAASETEDEEPDELYDNIAGQLGIEETEKTTVVETEPSHDAELEPAAALTETISEVIADQPDEKQSEIKERLVHVVRSIEILKRSRTAEECKDAIDGLKESLTALFDELGYDEPEKIAAELLNEYHLRSIDETINEVLKRARQQHAYSFKMPSVPHLVIGRHVVSLIFASTQNGCMFRSVFFAENPI